MYGIRLKQLRKQRKINQVELARRLGISRTTLSHHETGRNEPDVVMLIKYAQYYNVSVDYILGISNMPVALTDEELRYLPLAKRLLKLPAKDKKIIEAVLRINESEQQ